MKKKLDGGGVADMAKAVEGRWTLRDRVTPAIQRMNKETLKYKSTVRNAQRSISKDWQNLKTGAFVVAAAVAATAYAVISLSKNMTDAAKMQIEAETKLSAVLLNVKGVTDQQINSLKDYASVLQNVGVVGDEVQLAGIQQVGTFQLQASTIKMLMPGMADLVAQQKGLNATQQDAVTIGNLVGKVMNGQTSALSRVGISFTDAQAKVLKFGTEQQKAATLAEVLKANVGGVNAALAATDQGKIQQATNAWGDMKEQVGAVILMIEGKFAKLFMDKLPKIQSVVQKVSDGLANWANNGGVDRVINGMRKAWGAIKDVWNIISSVYNFFKDNWSLIGPIVYTIVGALVAYKLATFGANAITLLFGKTSMFAAIKTAVMGTAALVASGQLTLMGAAQWALNAAMTANPIGVVITILGLLVLAGIYVVKNWEAVKLAGMKTWNVLVGAVQWAVNKYIDYANFMIRIYKFAWDSIEFAGISIWNVVLSAAQSGVNGLIGLFNSAVGTLVGGVNKLIDKLPARVRKLMGVDGGITFNGIGKVDFSAAKGVAVKPVWDSDFGIPKVNLGGAKFSEDSIMAQTKKAQEERDKKNAAHTKALNDNTTALAGNTGATDVNTNATGDNTDETKGLTGTLKNGVSVNMTGEQIADGLFPRLERHLYGTS